jgi:predicted neutral ceramidase superfamily lipid hydrolase
MKSIKPIKTSYEFTPSPFTLILIFLLSFLFWKLEIDFLYKSLGGTWYSVLLLLISFLITPFVIWWIIGKIVYLTIKTNKK